MGLSGGFRHHGVMQAHDRNRTSTMLMMKALSVSIDGKSDLHDAARMLCERASRQPTPLRLALARLVRSSLAGDSTPVLERAIRLLRLSVAQAETHHRAEGGYHHTPPRGLRVVDPRADLQSADG